MISAKSGKSIVRRAPRRAGGLLVLTCCITSCGDDDATDNNPRHDGGASGRDAARPMPDAALDSGMRDTGIDRADASARDGAAAASAGEFRVRFTGDLVSVDAPAGLTVYDHGPCAASHAIELRDGNGWWTPLVDQRPHRSHLGYYLEDTFVGPDVHDCDFTCQPWTTRALGNLATYVQIAERAPPVDADYGECFRPDTVPVFQVRRLDDPHPAPGEVGASMLLRARFSYSTAEQCSTWEEAIVEFEVSNEGVCCPIGEAGPGTNVPAGGWAPDTDSCWSWPSALDLSRIEDAHGCPALIHTRGEIDSCFGVSDGGTD